MVLLQLHHKFQVHFIVRPSRHHDFYQVKFFLNLEKILIAEAVGQRCSLKKVFLEISQNSQENTCASLFFNKIAGLFLQHTSGGCFCNSHLFDWCFIMKINGFESVNFVSLKTKLICTRLRDFVLMITFILTQKYYFC